MLVIDVYVPFYQFARYFIDGMDINCNFNLTNERDRLALAIFGSCYNDKERYLQSLIYLNCIIKICLINYIMCNVMYCKIHGFFFHFIRYNL